MASIPHFLHHDGASATIGSLDALEDPMTYMDAVNMSNRATAASQAGDYATAEALHRRVLQKKSQAGHDAVSIALSKNGLGEALASQGKFEEARDVLRKSLSVRATKGTGFDAAVTRENLAFVYQALGQLDEATRVRGDGVSRGQVCCSHDNCPGQTFAIKDLQRCGGCKMPWYCSKTCQVQDWKKRHKAQCKNLKELQQ